VACVSLLGWALGLGLFCLRSVGFGALFSGNGAGWLISQIIYYLLCLGFNLFIFTFK